MRIKLTVAYDGTAYVGYQSQTNGVAIQDVLEEALAKLFERPIRTMSASRTDTGVHAEGNVAVFDVETRIEAGKIAYALNTYLPEDIRIVKSEEVPDDFHPRFQETVKTYEYRILNRAMPDPLLRLYAMHYYYPLDADAMHKAAQALIGEHDFSAFCAAGNSTKTTVRKIYRADVVRDGDLITFTITGNGFLYNMVRIIAGTLIEIGSGRCDASEMEEILASGKRERAGATAIAKGLTLKEIRYPEWEEEQ